VDIDPVKLTEAAKAGATSTLNGRDTDASSKLTELAVARSTAPSILSAARTRRNWLGALRKGGKLILVGLFGGEIPLSVGSTILRALTIQGSHLGSIAELKAGRARARREASRYRLRRVHCRK
jgi:D-arabinose 1-dehydrogenase-like Zn-dependent alcohol dehydrogenase